MEEWIGLRLHNKRWYPFIFLLGSAAILAVWFNFAKGHPPELLLSALAAVAGFFYFMYRQHLDETKLFKELFVEFNARYDRLNDGLNRILVGPRGGNLRGRPSVIKVSYFSVQIGAERIRTEAEVLPPS